MKLKGFFLSTIISSKYVDNITIIIDIKIFRYTIITYFCAGKKITDHFHMKPTYFSNTNKNENIFLNMWVPCGH